MDRAKANRPRKSKAQPLLHEKGGLLGELVHLHLGLFQLFAQEVGYSMARLKLVHELLHEGQPGVGISELAFRLGVTPALVTRQVQELEAEGWVRRRKAPRDGRRSLVLLSAQGRREGVRLHAGVHDFEALLLDGLGREDLATAERVLSTVRARVESRLRTPGRHRDAGLGEGRG